MVCSNNNDDRWTTIAIMQDEHENKPDQLQVYKEALELEEHLDEEKLALLTNQADILQFRMSILAAMMTLQEHQTAAEQENNSSTNWIEWCDDDISAITDPNWESCASFDFDLTSPCATKRYIQPRKSSFLTKRRKTDPITPDAIRRVKFFATLDRDREYRWSAMA